MVLCDDRVLGDYMGKESLGKLQESFQSSGGYNDPLVKAISDRKKELTSWVKSWGEKDKEKPKE